jgi:peroxiredoxin
MENTPLKVGQPAPDFEMMNQDKTKIKLSDFRGKKKVVLLFYPMDFSPICTQEHCSFGPNLGKIAKDDQTIVFGVSVDSPFAHAAFRKQFNIPYDLLADTSRKVVKAYGLWAGEEPYNAGRRATVVVDKNGNIAFFKEQVAREPRKIEEIEQAAMIDDLLTERAMEGGERIDGSR